jgi:hypothetical protein
MNDNKNIAVEILLMVTVTVTVLGAFSAFAVKAQQDQLPLQQQSIKLEETIRGNQEQPKVLTIVPWQSPKEKQALPSLILQRLNKKFQPLERDEFQRQIQFFDSYENIDKSP